jgi:PAS domain S-box-containing protein
LSQEQGLSYNTLTSFTQDKQGFLWIGTFNGLNRYDGVHFTVFPRNATTSSTDTTIPYAIRIVYADKQDVIWLVDFNDAIWRFFSASETFTRIAFTRPNIPRDYINFLKEDAAGVLWLTTTGGLFRFDKASEKFIHHSVQQNGAATPTPLQTALAGIEESIRGNERTMWMRKRGGLVELDMKRHTAQHHNLLDSLADKQFFYSNIMRDSSGFVWFSDLVSVYCFDVRSKQIILRIPQEHYVKFSTHRNPPKNHFMTRTMLCAPDGSLWIGSYGGLVVVRYTAGDPRTYSLQLLQHDEAQPMSLSGNAIRTLLADKSGVVWAGGEPFGINKYTPYKQKFLLFRHLPFDENSLGDNYVRGICLAKSGILWVATHFGGISRYDPQSGIWTRFRDDIDKKIPNHLRLPVNEIWTVFEDHQGIIWAGTRGSGLLRFDAAFGGFKQSPLLPDTSIIQVISGDREGNLFVGTRGNNANTGLYIIPPTRTKSAVRFISTLPKSNVKFMSGDVMAIHKDRSGTLWFGGMNELFRIQAGSERLEDVSDNIKSILGVMPANFGFLITSILEDRSGRIWFSCKGRGLAWYDAQTGKFGAMEDMKKLPNIDIYAVLEDDAGNFWISSDAGLTCWNREQNTFRTFTTADGLQGREYNRMGYCKGINGMMAFGGTNGLNVFHPAYLPFNPSPPRVSLTSVKIFAEEYPPQSICTISSDGSSTLMLRYDQNFLTFQFTAMDFHVPENNQYAYQLEGLDKNWIYSGTRREAVYTSLDPGTYKLRVKAANNDGVWNDAGLTLNVVILPPWWQTWWFRTILILAGLGAIGLVLQTYRRRIQRLQQHRQELLSHIAERERAEVQLLRSEEKFRALFETSTLGMVLWQNDGTILEGNVAFLRLLGYADHEVVHLNFWQILGEAHSGSITHSLQQRRAFGPVEQVLVQKNGEKLAVVLYGIAIGNDDGNNDFERVWSVMEDVTERKRATDALLRYQLNPHFMFNVLNSVNALMAENQRNAKRMIIQFSSLLRHTLVASTRQTAPLGDEIEAVEHYLTIEKIRFEERLETSIDAERAALTLNVPVFLVQPLVENAIKYGAQSSDGALHISVVACIRGDELQIEVANSGVWQESLEASNGQIRNGVARGALLTKKHSTGIGLANLRKRLEQYYPDAHSMTIAEEQGTVRVCIAIALKELSQMISKPISES